MNKKKKAKRERKNMILNSRMMSQEFKQMKILKIMALQMLNTNHIKKLLKKIQSQFLRLSNLKNRRNNLILLKIVKNKNIARKSKQRIKLRLMLQKKLKQILELEKT